MQVNSELVGRLVVGQKRDGRREYDPQAKQELVRQCLRPGVSVSRMALQHGVNANLLRLWITKSQMSTASHLEPAAQAQVSNTRPAFVAVQLESGAAHAPSNTPVRASYNQPKLAGARAMRLHAQLPNGVVLDIEAGRADELMPVLQLLGALACSS